MTELEEIVDEGTEHKTWKGKLWSVVKVILIITVTGGLLYWVFSKVPFQKIKYRLTHADRAWMGAAILCYLTSIIFSAWRLMSFFKSIDLRLDRRFNLRLYFLGLCYNLLLPGGIGGDGYKIYLLHKRYKLPTKKVFWAIFFDRLSGFWAIGLIAVALILFIPDVHVHKAIPSAIFVSGTLVYYFVVWRFFKDYMKNFFQAHLKAILVQSFQVSAIICLLMGQNFSGKFAPYLLTFLISSLATILPSIGGGGVREAIFDNLSKPFHLMEDLAVYLSICFYLISILVALFGVYYVINNNRLMEGLPSMDENKKDK